MRIDIENLRQGEGVLDQMLPLKERIESKLNLSRTLKDEKPISLKGNKIMRICLIAGLGMTEKRNMEEVKAVVLSKSSNRLYSSFFTYENMRGYFEALLKLRYQEFEVDWTDTVMVSRIIAYETLRGKDYLLNEANLNAFLFHEPTHNGGGSTVPALDLLIGDYGDAEMEAVLRLNARSVPNAQVLIAGATGSGKTNLLAVLISQMRQRSADTPYPVNFLLFDYKGEFSDPANSHWLNHFDVDRTCILDPVQRPLPFSPFKDFTGRTIQEINLYSTEMAGALCALDNAKISANMNNRLSESIVAAYGKTHGAPITFDLLLSTYRSKMDKPDKEDSVSSVLNQLVRANLFEREDKMNLVEESLIVKMDAFPKDGPLAKAIVYFIISKLNILYEQLPPQAVTEEYVQIRHFTIIDEAHYMLDFDNRPLRNLIAVGRNKGLSIILATQNMASYKSKHFDFYANAQYPLIMKQQTIDDQVIKDLFGANGSEMKDIRNAIAGLQLGELIVKDASAFELGIGKKYKRIKVNRLI